MSVTADLRVAVQYSASGDGVALLFKIITRTFMEHPVNLNFLSAFPELSEHLYPPLTFLRPTGRQETVALDFTTFTVVEVIPCFAS